MLRDPRFIGCIRIQPALNEAEQAWFEYSEFDEDVSIELPPRRDILTDSDIAPQ